MKRRSFEDMANLSCQNKLNNQFLVGDNLKILRLKQLKLINLWNQIFFKIK